MSRLGSRTSLFRFKARQNRATRVLNYLGEVLVNGNPEMAGRRPPQTLVMPPVPKHETQTPPPGTKQLLDSLGAEAFARYTRDSRRLLVTDTTFRDAHQSLMATRMRSHDMLRIADYVAHHLSGLYSLEMWGGATFDVSMRFLLEDPWVRLQKLRTAVPNICFQMLLRASNAVGYTAYHDNVVRRFVEVAAKEGIDIFRIFDSLNWLPSSRSSG